MVCRGWGSESFLVKKSACAKAPRPKGAECVRGREGKPSELNCEGWEGTGSGSQAGRLESFRLGQDILSVGNSFAFLDTVCTAERQPSYGSWPVFSTLSSAVFLDELTTHHPGGFLDEFLLPFICSADIH